MNLEPNSKEGEQLAHSVIDGQVLELTLFLQRLRDTKKKEAFAQFFTLLPDYEQRKILEKLKMLSGDSSNSGGNR